MKDLFYGIKSMFKCFKKPEKKKIIGFGIFLLIALVSFYFTDKYMIKKFFVLIAPMVIYFIYLGYMYQCQEEEENNKVEIYKESYIDNTEGTSENGENQVSKIERRQTTANIVTTTETVYFRRKEHGKYIE